MDLLYVMFLCLKSVLGENVCRDRVEALFVMHVCLISKLFGFVVEILELSSSTKLGMGKTISPPMSQQGRIRGMCMPMGKGLDNFGWVIIKGVMTKIL